MQKPSIESVEHFHKLFNESGFRCNKKEVSHALNLLRDFDFYTYYHISEIHKIRFLLSVISNTRKYKTFPNFLYYIGMVVFLLSALFNHLFFKGF